MADTSACSNPAMRKLVLSYCLGQLKAQRRNRFEEHAYECGSCRKEVKRVDRHLQNFKRDGIVDEELIRHAPDISKAKRK